MKTDNELIAEFMGEGYWQIWKKKEFGGYKPYFADKYETHQQCLEAIEREFIDGHTASGSPYFMLQYKLQYEAKMITKEYDTSWNGLMPVVHKLLKTWTPTKGTWPYEYNQLANLSLGRSLSDVYDVTVIFIKWYNANYQPLSTH